MTGYEGSHQDWLEDRASDQLERQRFERAGGFHHAEPWFRLVVSERFVMLHQTADNHLVVTMTLEEAVNFAHAILAEVEITQRETGAAHEHHQG